MTWDTFLTLRGVFLGSWHFNTSASSNVDEVLDVHDHEHVEHPLVLALDVPLCLG